jgi:hypothetical protein
VGRKGKRRRKERNGRKKIKKGFVNADFSSELLIK